MSSQAVKIILFSAVLTVQTILYPHALKSGNSPSLSGDPLTRQEREWYRNNKNRITVSLYTEFAPYEFLDEKGKPAGVAEEVFQLIEKNLNISLRRKYYRRWQDILNDARAGKLVSIQAVQNTAARRRYLNFTDPYLFIPNAIIVRKNWQGKATMKGLAGKKVAIVEGFASIDYLKKYHPELRLVTVENDADGLKKLALNQVDANIMNLGQATYYIDKLGITNLMVGENIDFLWRLCIGVPKNYPELLSIMKKGLLMVKKEEIVSLRRKWVNIEPKPFYRMKGFQIVAGITSTLFILIIIVVSIWNRILAREVGKKTWELRESHDNLEKKVKERTAELLAAHRDINELKGLIPICSHCKKIREDDGYWSQVDEYLIHHTDALVSHSLCPNCAMELYGEHKWFKKNDKNSEK